MFANIMYDIQMGSKRAVYNNNDNNNGLNGVRDCYCLYKIILDNF